MIRKLLLGGLLAVVVLSGTSPVFARDGRDSSESTQSDRSGTSTVETINQTVTQKVEDDDEHQEGLSSQRGKTQLQQVEDKKTELRNELRARQEDRQPKLEGRRLAQCENRQVKINQLLNQSAEHGKSRLARIQQFEEGVKGFYAKHELTSDKYDAAVAAADAKEALAIAAVDVVGETNFDCTKADSANPGQSLRTVRENKRAALNAYRDSVRELFDVVREALQAKESAASSTEGDE